NLTISDEILGYGSHGTVVYRGTFENRPVAVKRMLLDFYDVANHEISLLQESDDHPNVIRYFCSEQSDRFLYIALELCLANLEDIIDKKKELFDDPQNILFQMASGLNHLHKLNIVHRDIKPQNILVTNSKTNPNGYRVLISDFGLCKKLEPDQSSFRGTTAASGTSGWRAPELLTENNQLRLNKGVDIFSLGLVFYFVLASGKHPFGDRYSRESNILRNNYELDDIELYEARNLIESMLNSNAKERPTSSMILKHPYFWTNERKIEFLLKVSDKLNILDRDSFVILSFEKISKKIFKNDWKNYFNPAFFENLNSFRRYDSTKLLDLLRVFRNKYHHIHEIPSEFNITEESYYPFFSNLFPTLLITVYQFIGNKMKNE
ncbi:bifunctional endoribonuclease/protein kinase IRE1, partial [Ascoidea rubescens DSM 1968]